MEQGITPGVPQWMASLRSAMFNAVKESDVKEMVENLVKRAKDGDAQALRMVFEYVLGGKQPPQTFIQQNVMVKPPKKRTPALPGTQGKLEVMRRRAARGEGLFHEQDA